MHVKCAMTGALWALRQLCHPLVRLDAILLVCLKLAYDLAALAKRQLELP